LDVLQRLRPTLRFDRTVVDQADEVGERFCSDRLLHRAFHRLLWATDKALDVIENGRVGSSWANQGGRKYITKGRLLHHLVDDRTKRLAQASFSGLYSWIE